MKSNISAQNPNWSLLADKWTNAPMGRAPFEVLRLRWWCCSAKTELTEENLRLNVLRLTVLRLSVLEAKENR